MKTEDMAGSKEHPENEKVRAKRMTLINAKIDEYREQYNTLKSNNDNFKREIERLSGEIEANNHTIEKLREQKNEYVKELERLRTLDLEVKDLATLEKEKKDLEAKVDLLKKELSEANKAFEQIEKSLKFDDE